MQSPDFDSIGLLHSGTPRFRGLAAAREPDWVAEVSPSGGYLIVATASGPPRDELRELVRALHTALVAGGPPVPAAAGRPVAINRVVATLRAAHGLILRAGGSAPGDGIGVLLTCVIGDRLHVVHAGGAVRLMRVTPGGRPEPVAGPLPEAFPTRIGGDGRVRIEVASTSLGAGDLYCALPVVGATGGNADELLDSLGRWANGPAGAQEGAGDALPDATSTLDLPPAALPPAFACITGASDVRDGGGEWLPPRAPAMQAGVPAPTPGTELAPDATADSESPANADSWDGLMQAARAAVHDIARHAAAEITRATGNEAEAPAGAVPAAPAGPAGPGIDANDLDRASATGQVPTAAPGADALGDASDDQEGAMPGPPPIPSCALDETRAAALPAQMHPDAVPPPLPDIQPAPGSRPDGAAFNPPADDPDDILPEFLPWRPATTAGGEDPDNDTTLDEEQIAQDTTGGACAPELAWGSAVPSVLRDTPPDGHVTCDAEHACAADDAVGAPAATDADEADSGVIFAPEVGTPEVDAVDLAGRVAGTGDEQAAIDDPDESVGREHGARGEETAVAVHPWIARRQGHRQRADSHRGGWIAIGLLSAAIGTVGALAVTGGLERVVRAVPGLGNLVEPGGAARMTIPLDAPVVFPIRTQPAGAELVVDGQTTGRRTPITDLELAPGTHAVELRLGDLGSWSGELTVPAGIAITDGAELLLAGSLTAVTDKTVAGVEVYLDDTPLGPAPVSRDRVPAGQHVVRFKGPGGYSWAEEVVVRVDEMAEVTARMDGVESFGLVTVRSYGVGPTGKSYVDGDHVVVDGESRGTTPAEIHLEAGRHVIDVTRPGHGGVKQVVAVMAGDRRFVDIRLDRLPALSITHEPPSRLAIDATPLMSVTLSGQGIDRQRRVYMHVELDGDWQRLRMGAVPGADATYVVALPVTSAYAGEAVRYYFTCEDAAGQTAYTTIFSVRVQ